MWRLGLFWQENRSFHDLLQGVRLFSPETLAALSQLEPLVPPLLAGTLSPADLTHPDATIAQLRQRVVEMVEVPEVTKRLPRFLMDGTRVDRPPG